jgi:hypothetical protein
MRKLWSRLGIAFGILVVGTAAWAWRGEMRLYLNGKVVSTNVLVNNGVAYVPIKDVAAALDMTAEKRSDGYALSKSGGATQVEGMQGKVGDDLFNGMYRLKVTRVTRQAAYTRQYSKGDAITAPDGKEVVAIFIRLKNGTKKAQTIDLVFPGSNTAVTDTDEHSFGPITGLACDTPSRAADLLPGAAVDTVLIFWVPKGAVLKDLVFEVGVYAHGPAFRVSLKDATSSN